MFANARVENGIHDAEPNDVYVDDAGKLWRVVGVHGEPSVIMQEVESLTPDSPVRKHGGVSGLMWHGWKRVFRREPVKTDPKEFTQQWATY